MSELNNPLEYIEINRKSWNKRTEYHLASDFYDNDTFIKGRSSLNDIELALLTDLNNKKVLHLQCHFGQDSISLSRLGAQVTAVDLSDKAITEARKLAKQTHQNVTFINCDIYDLEKHLDEKFDIIYTSYGTIGWLPDLNKWAYIISQFLKPKGKLIFVEFHPVVWMFDDDFKSIAYHYFNVKPIIETETATYADKNADIDLECVTWNHNMAEVVNCLIDNGMQINSLQEFDYSPYDCFKHTIKVAPNKYRIAHLENKIPMVYSIEATLIK